MRRISVWTKLGRSCRRVWLRSFDKIRRRLNRPYSKKRYKALGEKKGFYVVSRRTVNNPWGETKKRKPKARRGANYNILHFSIASILCAVVLPIELIGNLLTPKKHKANKKSTSAEKCRTKTAGASHAAGGSRSAQYAEASPQEKKNAFSRGFQYFEDPMQPEQEAEQEGEQEKIFDESTPKSRPKSNKDQYIRKRMVIAGSYYCDPEIISKLNIGTYFNVIAEPSNPHDKNAVALLYDGEKIGYIPQKDNTPFAVSLKLGRRIYGVITDVVSEGNKTSYEFETWYDYGAG